MKLESRLDDTSLLRRLLDIGSVLFVRNTPGRTDGFPRTVINVDLDLARRASVSFPHFRFGPSSVEVPKRRGEGLAFFA